MLTKKQILKLARLTTPRGNEAMENLKTMYENKVSVVQSQKKKEEAQDEIMRIINKFQSDTGVKVTGIELLQIKIAWNRTVNQGIKLIIDL